MDDGALTTNYTTPLLLVTSFWCFRRKVARLWPCSRRWSDDPRTAASRGRSEVARLNRRRPWAAGRCPVGFDGRNTPEGDQKNACEQMPKQMDSVSILVSSSCRDPTIAR